MIAVVQNAAQALNFLFEDLTYWRSEACRQEPLIFDLLEELVPTEIPYVLYECCTCDATMHFNLGDNQHDMCPRCGEKAEVVAVAGLVIQGAVVLWRES